MSTPPASDLATLNRDIAQLETDVAQLEAERRVVRRATRRAARRARYLRLARSLRAPARSIPQYQLALFAIGPLGSGVVALVILSLLLGSWSVAFGGFFLAAVASATLLAALLYHPTDDSLAPALAEADAKLAAETARLGDLDTKLGERRDRLNRLSTERRELAATDKLQRAMLLQRPWKSMRSVEWEDYVVEVFRTLGAKVERGTPSQPVAQEATGPRGVVRQPVTPLFVTLSPRCFAVAAVSEIRPFHAAAVQQLINQLAPHGCDAMAIVTNARITTGSKELARSRNCTLIGEDEFPDFVLGRLEL